MYHTKTDEDGGRSSWTFTVHQVIPAAPGMQAIFAFKNERKCVVFPVIAFAVVETRYQKYDKNKKEIKSDGWSEKNFDAICFGYDDDFFSVKYLLLHSPDHVFLDYEINGKSINPI